jgi:predicted RNase H-like HicB family nuclease
MVVPAGQPRRVLHYQAAVVPDGDGGFTARCLELGWLCAHGLTVAAALARLRDLVEMELSHRPDHPWPLFAMVVPLDVPMPTEHPRRPSSAPAKPANAKPASGTASGPPERPGGTTRTSARHGAGAREPDRRTGRSRPGSLAADPTDDQTPDTSCG